MSERQRPGETADAEGNDLVTTAEQMLRYRYGLPARDEADRAAVRGPPGAAARGHDRG